MTAATVTIQQLHDFHHRMVNQTELDKSFQTHEELVAENLLQVLEERYQEMSKDEKDGIIMLLIENTLD